MPFKPVDQAIKIILGPCIDDTDFKTREEALTYDQAGMEIDVILEKHDGTVTVTAVTPTTGGVYDWAHTDQGYYELELPASGGGDYNNDTEGILTVVGYCTGVLPFRSASYDIVPEKVYNSMIEGSDNLEVDTTLIEGTDATDMILGAVVDDATQIDASALNALSALAPGNTLADVDDISGLNNISAAEVNAEVVDVLTVDTHSEPGAVHSWPSTLTEMIVWICAFFTNAVTQTSSTQKLRNQADSGDVASAAVSDDGTTFKRGSFS